jgi:hypothetical protein
MKCIFHNLTQLTDTVSFARLADDGNRILTTKKNHLSYKDQDIYTGCPWGNVPDSERMFLRLKYTDITQNTYIRS